MTSAIFSAHNITSWLPNWIERKSVDRRKLTDLHTLEYPTPGKQIQSYLGTCNFFHEFIPNYSTTVQSQLHLMCYETKTSHSHSVKTRNKPLMLCEHFIHEFSQPFYVATDASNVGIDTVLYQLPKCPKYPNHIRYISFASRSLQERERRYSTTRIELLAIVIDLNRLYCYLWGRQFEL